MHWWTSCFQTSQQSPKVILAQYWCLCWAVKFYTISTGSNIRWLRRNPMKSQLHEQIIHLLVVRRAFYWLAHNSSRSIVLTIEALVLLSKKDSLSERSNLLIQKTEEPSVSGLFKEPCTQPGETMLVFRADISYQICRYLDSNVFLCGQDDIHMCCH